MTAFTCDKCGRTMASSEVFDLRLVHRDLNPNARHIRKEICTNCAVIFWEVITDMLSLSAGKCPLPPEERPA